MPDPSTLVNFGKYIYLHDKKKKNFHECNYSFLCPLMKGYFCAARSDS